eukprot:TRINITY_DN1942_c0_g1_i1.p1 TRINITY_DN1942_c0_g1~~TRINITY_DN1942_c0_g1_i1.p1  ORF type:complete len:1189 (+),score=310.57 TRINITY_DN1942_c0_g1_i1:238-3804(+)
MPVVCGASHGAARYTGDTAVSGQRHGFGIICYDNGERYIGDWKSGQRDGLGLYVYGDGTVYDGQWSCDRPNGTGICFYATGNIYEGDWSKGLLSGKGAMYYVEGDVYDGEWLDGRLHGDGQYTNADGTVHRGRWMEDQEVTGNGVVTAASSEMAPQAGLLERLSDRKSRLEQKRQTLGDLLSKLISGCEGGIASPELLDSLRTAPRLTSVPRPVGAEDASYTPPAQRKLFSGGATSPEPVDSVRVPSVSSRREQSPSVERTPDAVPPSEAPAAVGGSPRLAMPDADVLDGSPTTSPCLRGAASSETASVSSESDSSEAEGDLQDAAMEIPKRVFDRLKRSRHGTITRGQLADDLQEADAEVRELSATVQHRHAWNKVLRQGAARNPDQEVGWDELEKDIRSAMTRRDQFTVTKLDDGSVGFTFRGNRITDVLRGGPAERAGLRRGMVLLRVADRPVLDLTEDVDAAVGFAARVFTVAVRRDQGPKKARSSRFDSGTRALQQSARWQGASGPLPTLTVTPAAEASENGIPNVSFSGLIPSVASRALAALARPRGLGGSAYHSATIALYGGLEDRLEKQRQAALTREKDIELKARGPSGEFGKQDEDLTSRLTDPQTRTAPLGALDSATHTERDDGESPPQPSLVLAPPGGAAAVAAGARWEARGVARRSESFRLESARQAASAVQALRGPTAETVPLHWKTALAKCGPAREQFQTDRFVKHLGMMLFPFPFLPCFPFAPSIADWERRVVVAGARPRLWEDPTPANFLIAACMILPLLVISILWARKGAVVEDSDGAVGPTDLYIPLGLYLFFVVVSGAHHAFPREPHALEKLDDQCFNALARVAYDQIPLSTHHSTNEFVVQWNTNARCGPIRFQANSAMKRRWRAASVVLGLIVGMSVPVHRLIKHDTLFGESSSDRVTAILSACAMWGISSGLFELVLGLHFQQRQLVSQLTMLSEVASLGPSDDPRQTSLFNLLEVPAHALNTVIAPDNSELHNFIGWFFVRSFTYYGSPALNHTARCAVMGVLVIGAMLASVALICTFISDLAVYRKPERQIRGFTAVSCLLVLMVPLITRHLQMWQSVRRQCKIHYRLVASAGVFKHAEALRCHLQGQDADAAEAQLQALLLSSVSTMLADQDFRPRIVGIEIGPKVTLVSLGVSVLGLTTLAFRWYYHINPIDEGTPAPSVSV